MNFKRGYLLNEVTLADLDQLRLAKGGDNFSSSYKSESLNSVKVCVLDGHHSPEEEQVQKVFNLVEYEVHV